MSVLSLASAISNDMFDLIYKSCPKALQYALHDDINPMCIAALKNDKTLFFKLIQFGVDVSEASLYRFIMIDFL